MRLVSNVLMLFLASLLFVACSGDDDKNKNGNGNGGDGGDDGLTLKFDGLANFTPTKEPEDFKVTVYKGTAVDDTSTLEITVEIVCGDNKASKTVAAEKGVAEFKINDFSKAKFAEVAEYASCKATATAEGATEGSNKFWAVEYVNGIAALTVEANGMVKIPSWYGKVALSECPATAYLVKWTTTSGDNPHTVEVAPAAGFNMKKKKADTNIYFSGPKSATCKVTLGTDEEDDLSSYTAPAGAKAIMRGALTDTGFSTTFTGGNKDFSWYVKKGEEDPLSGSVTNHATTTEIPVTGMDDGTWVIWVKNADGVQKL